MVINIFKDINSNNNVVIDMISNLGLDNSVIISEFSLLRLIIIGNVAVTSSNYFKERSQAIQSTN